MLRNTAVLPSHVRRSKFTHSAFDNAPHGYCYIIFYGFSFVVVLFRVDHPSHAVHVLVPPSRLDRVLKHLSSQGYDLGPEPSKEFLLEEGDALTLTFINNIRCPEGDPLPLAYFANLDNEIHFTMKEVDRFLQKQFNSYRGVIHLSRINVACTRKETVKYKEDRGKTDEPRSGIVSTHQVSIPKVSETTKVVCTVCYTLWCLFHDERFARAYVRANFFFTIHALFVGFHQTY
jgi:hypothetical protein